MSHYTIGPSADDRDAWLAARAGLVTGSEMAAVMGESPYLTRDEVVAAKRSGVERQVVVNRHMWWGEASEAGNLQVLQRLLGCRVRSMRPLLYQRDTRIGCTLDGLMLAPAAGSQAEFGAAVSEPRVWEQLREQLCGLRAFGDGHGLGLVEAKQSAGYKPQVAAWYREPPRHYWWQVQTALMVTRLPWGLLYARLGAADAAAHVIFVDHDAHEAMRSAVADLWKEVEDG